MKLIKIAAVVGAAMLVAAAANAQSVDFSKVAAMLAMCSPNCISVDCAMAKPALTGNLSQDHSATTTLPTGSPVRDAFGTALMRHCKAR